MTVRRLFVAFLAAVVSVALVVVPSPAQAAPAAAAARAVGRLTPVQPVRVLDTGAGRVSSGSTTTVQLPDMVPADVTAVLVNLTVTQPAGSGYVTAFRDGAARPTVSNVNYVRGQTVRNLTSVPVSGPSKWISLYNQGAVVSLTADLTGWVRPGEDRTDAQRGTGLDALGGFAAVGPTRVLDTRIGLGAKAAPVGGVIGVKVTGAAVPADASAVLVNLTAVTPVAAGYLTAFPAGVNRPTASNVNFAVGRTTPVLALVPIGDNGKISLYNGSGRPLQLLADVQGYVAGGDPTTVGAIGSLAPQRLLDTRPTPVAANVGRTVQVTGRGGVPLSGVGGVVVTVTAAEPSAAGSLTVSGADTASANLTFAAGATVANMAVLRPDSAGRVLVTNASAGHTQILVDVIGYVAGTDVTVPGTTVSRYTTDPAKIAATGATSEGCRDGASGATFVLLDVGAQSRTGPELSTANPGVALAKTSPVIRLTYGNLVKALTGYLAEFARCGDQQARIAIGTNTSGSFSGATAYPANARGIDWATKVIEPLQQVATSGVEIVGANDVEAGFSATEAYAESWTTSFLARTDADLVYNGSLDFCSDDYAKAMSCGPVKDENGVTKTWTPAHYVKLTYGLAPGRISVLPQIYFSVPSQAAQWRNLYVASGQKLTFEGSLTQYGTSNSAAAGFDSAQGWSALHHALSTVVENPSLPVATDLSPT